MIGVSDPGPCEIRAGAHPGARRGGILVRHWPAVAVSALMVVSSYRWRTRPAGQAVSGALDLTVLLEVAVYGLVGAGALVLLARSHGAGQSRWASLRPPAPLAFGAAYTALIALSVTYAAYPAYAAVRAGQAGVVLLVAVAVAVLATRAQLHAAVHAYLVVVVASVAYGVAAPSTAISGLQEGRFTWLAIHPTISSVFTALAMVMALAYVVDDRRRPGPSWPRAVYALVAVVAAVALLASQTRGSVLGAVLGGACVVLLGRSGRRRVVLALSIAVVAALVFVATGDQVLAFLTRGEGADQLATLNYRTELWSYAWQVVVQQPLYGHGVGSPRGLFFAATGLGGSHNMVVNVVTEVGALGLAAWTALVVAVGLQLRARGAGALRSPSTARTGRRGSGAVLVGVLVGGDDRPLLAGVLVAVLASGLFYDGPGAVATVSSVWLFVIAGWLAVLRRRPREALAAPARRARASGGALRGPTSG